MSSSLFEPAVRHLVVASADSVISLKLCVCLSVHFCGVGKDNLVQQSDQH